MVLDNVLPQKDGVPFPFKIVIIHREMVDGSIGGIDPVLGTLGGEDRMLYREDKVSAGSQPAGNIADQGGEVGHIVEGQRAYHHIKAAGGEVQILHGPLTVFNGGMRILFPGGVQHLLGQVGAPNGDGAVVGGVFAVPAIAAAQVQYPLSGKIREQPFQLPPFSCAGKSFSGAGHLAVFIKKERVVITVFFHGELLSVISFTLYYTQGKKCAII